LEENRMPTQRYKSPLHEMTCTTPTALWNDSCAIAELSYSIENGAVGATSNPVIVGEVIKKEMHLWQERIPQIIHEMPSATEDEVTWKLIEEVSVRGAALLVPAFEQSGGYNGRLSIQTDPRFYRDSERIVAQATHFAALASNMIIKIPVTSAGIKAIEEATYGGISINATVNFSVPQAVAAAEAVERGLQRREREGKSISGMGPVCSIMVGRLDDWLKVVADQQNIITDPGYLDWAGVAVMKKAYRIFTERGYRLRLLSAAFRNHMHWSEFIGGDVVISPPYLWQKRFNASDVAVVPRIANPVQPQIVDELYRMFADFRRAYDENGMTIEEFDAFPPTRRTLRQFISAYADLVRLMREQMLPNPDTK
jgi:transaldolase